MKNYSNVTQTHSDVAFPISFFSHTFSWKYQILMRSTFNFLHSTPLYKELMLTLHHDEGMGREKTEYGKILCLFTKIFLTLKFIKKISQATRNNKLHKKKYWTSWILCKWGKITNFYTKILLKSNSVWLSHTKKYHTQESVDFLKNESLTHHMETIYS